MREAEVIARLRRIATAPEARGLLDDVAVLDGLVITHDSIAEGVHFLPTDPPASVGWKLVAVNLSDLAAKGATPRGACCRLTIAGTAIGRSDSSSGVEAACESYALPLIGGDTIALPPGAPRVLGMTAIGRAGPHTPDRAGRPARRCAVAGRHARRFRGGARRSFGRTETRPSPLVDIYRRPIPQLGAGRAARAACPRHDGRVRRAAARREAAGGGERMRRRDRPRRAAAVRCVSCEFAAMDATARLFAATARRRLCACSPRCPPSSTRQRFLYQTGPRWRASGALAAGDRVNRVRQRRAARRAAGEIGF